MSIPRQACQVANGVSSKELSLSSLHKSFTHFCFRGCQNPAHILCNPVGEKPHRGRPRWTYKWSTSQVSQAWSVDSNTENLETLEYGVHSRKETHLPTARKIKWASLTKLRSSVGTCACFEGVLITQNANIRLLCLRWDKGNKIQHKLHLLFIS